MPAGGTSSPGKVGSGPCAGWGPRIRGVGIRFQGPEIGEIGKGGERVVYHYCSGLQGFGDQGRE